MYDSRPDTWEHIKTVQSLLWPVIHDLRQRAAAHDRTKLEDPERTVLDEFTPANLANITFGSIEWDEFREKQADGLNHHYEHNRHHPEHFADGTRRMNLVDLIEMLADWKAATLRHEDGDLDRSITVLRERYGYGDELETLLRNTARDFGWITNG